MTSFYLQDICEYVFQKIGSHDKVSRHFMQKVIFLSIFGKTKINVGVKPVVYARYHGPFMKEVENVYKKEIFSMTILPDEVKRVVDDYYSLCQKYQDFPKILNAVTQSVPYFYIYMSESTIYPHKICNDEADRFEKALRYKVEPEEMKYIECFRRIKMKMGNIDYHHYTPEELYILRDEEISSEIFYGKMDPDYFIPLKSLDDNLDFLMEKFMNSYPFHLLDTKLTVCIDPCE